MAVTRSISAFRDGQQFRGAALVVKPSDPRYRLRTRIGHGTPCALAQMLARVHPPPVFYNVSGSLSTYFVHCEEPDEAKLLLYLIQSAIFVASSVSFFSSFLSRSPVLR